jgi:hypothetical protein
LSEPGFKWFEGLIGLLSELVLKKFKGFERLKKNDILYLEGFKLEGLPAPNRFNKIVV